ncbi:CHAT domain-containing protein [Thermomonospora cellulosilytica]|uniref:Tetratricopeptide (TPR) repeat protein n=1 Tax=Thermomonospora cellulosilytica TaxID=1411118 RepID=A0A7W3R950_9ACTN|nr:CHAT domain-containing protein [Thermomonospora cellulosilytica]MBA9004426.1 tetratricopeptide (TPR) repeat protein [Thermomonospora cellulosilytica]
MTATPLDLACSDPRRAHAAALAGLRAARDVEARIVALRAAALAAKELGRLDEGLEFLTEALAAAETAGLAYAAAQVRMNLVGLLAARGDLTGALAAADAAAGVLRDGDADRLAANRACALARAGRPDDALAAVAGALPRLRRGGDPATLAGLLINLGLAQALRGALAEAEASLAEAVAVADRAGLRAPAAMARGNLAFAVSRRGDLPRALRLYAAAEPELTGERLVQCRLDQAETLIAAGLPGEARPLLAAALDEAAARGYGCDVADGLLLLAHAELADGNPERATATAERARAAFAAQERTGWMLVAEHLLLRARWAAGDRSAVFWHTAVATAERLRRGGWAEPAADTRILAARLALHLGRSAGEPPPPRHGSAAVRVAAWHVIALHRSAVGDRRGALAAVRAGLRVADEHAAVFGAGELRARAADMSADLAELGLRLARTGRALLAAEERRRAIARRVTAVRPPADPERAAALTRLRTAAAEHAAATARGEDTVRLGRRLARLEAQVSALVRRSPSGGAPARAAGAADVIEALGSRALIELIRVGDELHAVTVAGGRCRRWALGPYRAVVRDAALVRYAVRRLARLGEDDADLRDAAGRTAAWLPAGLWRTVEGRELVIAPTGALHGLPWAVLPGLAGRAFTVVPSATAWVRAATAAPPDGHVVLAAGPGLPHAQAEISGLADVYPEALVLRGSGAGANAVRHALEGASLAHVAAHGEFREDNALFSHLRLADGPLLAHDLEELSAPPHTVVLSACDTGRTGGGDGTLGMVGVLLGLGTATVIASVTPVRDDGARVFMTGLHAGLRAGLTPAQAMARLPRSAGTLGFLCFGAG